MVNVMLAPTWDPGWKTVLMILLAAAVVICIVVIICIAVMRKGKPVAVITDHSNEVKENKAEGSSQNVQSEQNTVVQPQPVQVVIVSALPPVPYDISARVGYVPQPPAYTVVPQQNQNDGQNR